MAAVAARLCVWMALRVPNFSMSGGMRTFVAHHIAPAGEIANGSAADETGVSAVRHLAGFMQTSFKTTLTT